MNFVLKNAKHNNITYRNFIKQLPGIRIAYIARFKHINGWLKTNG